MTINDNKTMKTILIFIIQAYEALDEANGRVSDLCQVEVIEETADKAIARAKKLIKKKNYRIASIIEKERGQHDTN